MMPADWTTCEINGVVHAYHGACGQAFIAPQEHRCVAPVRRPATEPPSADLNELERIARANGYWHHIAPWASTLAALRAEVERLSAIETAARTLVGSAYRVDRADTVARSALNDLRAALWPMPTIITDPSVPPDEVEVRDATGKLVGKIVNLATPDQE